MKKEELATKRVVSANIDRVITGPADRPVGTLCIPDSRDLRVTNQGFTHEFGDGHTAIVVLCRNDGSAKSILEALNSMILSLATAQ